MNTGINTLIEQTKKELADLINQKLQQGMPISVVGLILDTLMYEVKNNIEIAIAQEQERVKEQAKAASKQVEHVPETNK